MKCCINLVAIFNLFPEVIEKKKVKLGKFFKLTGMFHDFQKLLQREEVESLKRISI